MQTVFIKMGRSQKLFFALLILIATQLHSTGAAYGDAVGKWKVGSEIQNIRIYSHATQLINLMIYDVNLASGEDFYFQVEMGNDKIAFINKTIPRSEFLPSESESEVPLAYWQGKEYVLAKHFGYTVLYVTLHTASGANERSNDIVDVAVMRNDRLDDKIFSITAATLVLLMFLNLGTVLDLERFKLIILKPIGPIISFCSRYVLMPTLGLGFGVLFFSGNKALRLALFFTSIAPSGGLANICSVFLKGNINLSLAATTINSLMALAMLPLWIYLLARVVFEESTLDVPYLQLAAGSVAVITALTVGVLLRIFVPKTTLFITKFLKPISLLLSLGLVALTIAINLFVFKEITWMVICAAFCLPLTGFVVSYVLSKILCRSAADSMTIAIETSVLNMTVPIVLLQYSLEDPKADMCLVVPIISSLMSLLLVLCLYTVRRCFGWNKKEDDHCLDIKEFEAIKFKLDIETGNDIKDLKSIKYIDDGKDIKDFEDAKDIKDLKDVKYIKDIKSFESEEDVKDKKDIKDIRDIADKNDIKDIKSDKDIKDIKDVKDIRDAKEITKF